MEFAHFYLSGERAQNKLENYMKTKFPNGKLPHINGYTCFLEDYSYRVNGMMVSICNTVIEEDGILIHIGTGGSDRFMKWGAEKKRNQEIYKSFKEWANKWELEVSPMNLGKVEIDNLD